MAASPAAEPAVSQHSCKACFARRACFALAHCPAFVSHSHRQSYGAPGQATHCSLLRHIKEPALEALDWYSAGATGGQERLALASLCTSQVSMGTVLQRMQLLGHV